jgi:phosphoserine phosphatase
MPPISLNHLSEQPLSQVLTLTKWYQVENAQLCLTENQPSRQQGLFITLFGDELTAVSADILLSFAAQNKVTISALCLYRPDTNLPAALVFHSHTELSDSMLIEFREKLRRLAADIRLQCACVVNPANLKQKGLMVMDMDSTAITIECIDEIARLAGVYDEVANVTGQAMAGKLAFNDSLYQRVAKLKGVDLQLLQPLKDELPLMSGIQALCHILKSHDWHLVIASGGFTWFAEALQKPLQLNAYYANELEISQGQLTGNVIGEIVNAQRKADILADIREKLGLTKAQTVAIGDGANDLIMMAEAGIGIAVHGKPKVVAQADAAICQGSLLQVLYLLAIPAESDN